MKPTEQEISAQAHQHIKANHPDCIGSKPLQILMYEKLHMAYVKSAQWAISLQPETDTRFNSLMETVNVIASAYRFQEKEKAERGLYSEAIEAKAKVEALEEIMKEAARICSMLKPQPPTK